MSKQFSNPASENEMLTRYTAEITSETEGIIPSLLQSDAPERNAIHRLMFYDTIPKYVWEPPTQKKRKVPRIIERWFSYNNNSYRLSLYPSCVLSAKKKAKYLYLGPCEELIDLTLRKLVQDRRHLEMGCGTYEFTLTMVQEELRRYGYTIPLKAIKKSLMVTTGARLKVETIDQCQSYGFNHYEGWQTHETDEGEIKLATKFIPIVEAAIQQRCLNYLDYNLALSLRSILSRQFLKRLTIDAIAAHSERWISYELLSLLRGYGMEVDEVSDISFPAVEESLQELKSQRVINVYEIDHKDSESPNVKVRLRDNFSAKCVNHSPLRLFSVSYRFE